MLGTHSGQMSHICDSSALKVKNSIIVCIGMHGGTP